MMARRALGVVSFVDVLAFRLKADRKSPDAVVARLSRHQRDQQRRVDAARKKRAERNVRNHLQTHRFFQRARHFLNLLLIRSRAQGRLAIEPERPITFNSFRASRFNDQPVRRQQHLHAAQDGAWLNNRAVSQQQAQRDRVDFRRNQPTRQQGLDLGSKNEAPAGARIQQRLDAHLVARQQQTFASWSTSLVVDGERKHAAHTNRKSSP